MSGSVQRYPCLSLLSYRSFDMIRHHGLSDPRKTRVLNSSRKHKPHLPNHPLSPFSSLLPFHAPPTPSSTRPSPSPPSPPSVPSTTHYTHCTTAYPDTSPLSSLLRLHTSVGRASTFSRSWSSRRRGSIECWDRSLWEDGLVRGRARRRRGRGTTVEVGVGRRRAGWRWWWRKRRRQMGVAEDEVEEG